MIRIGPIKLRSGWGFVDETGGFAIPPSYEELGAFSEGVASFKRDGKVGFIDTFGTEIVEPKFESIGWRMPHFSEGLCPVRERGQIGYIDRAGQWVIRPQFGDGFDFVDGKAITSADRYMVIDTSGGVLARLPIDDIKFTSYWPSSWNIFVGIVWQKNRHLSVGVDGNGSIVFPPRFPVLTEFWQGVAGFSESDWDAAATFGLVRVDGEPIKRPQFYNLRGFSEGIAKAGRSPTEFGFINTEGDWIIPPRFRQVLPFREGLACVTINGKQGFIDRSGEVVIEPKYRGEASFFAGYAQVEHEGKRAVIDRTGRVIWETEIESD